MTTTSTTTQLQLFVKISDSVMLPSGRADRSGVCRRVTTSTWMMFDVVVKIGNPAIIQKVTTVDTVKMSS